MLVTGFDDGLGRETMRHRIGDSSDLSSVSRLPFIAGGVGDHGSGGYGSGAGLVGSVNFLIIIEAAYSRAEDGSFCPRCRRVHGSFVLSTGTFRDTRAVAGALVVEVPGLAQSLP